MDQVRGTPLPFVAGGVYGKNRLTVYVPFFGSP